MLSFTVKLHPPLQYKPPGELIIAESSLWQEMLHKYAEHIN